jgi:hypothetical protein
VSKSWDWSETRKLRLLLLKQQADLDSLAPFATSELERIRKGAAYHLSSHIRHLETLASMARKWEEANKIKAK